jgi:hypothetical protein
MALKHNKKRNCGLLVEFFAQHMAECMATWKHDRIKSVKDIWKKHVKNDSEIQKEIQLFKTLYETKLQNEEVALDLLKLARENAQQIDSNVLEQEKTELIRDIQKEIKDPNFFNKSIDDYQIHATIQILLNSWIEKPLTEGVINPALSELQDRVLTHMLKKSDEKATSSSSSSDFLTMTENDIDHMVVGIMNEKLNKKFDDLLSEEQKTILRQFVFGNDKETLANTLKTLNEETNLLIDKENSIKKSEKLIEIKRMLEDDFKDVSEPDEQCIMFYMTVSKLHEELGEEDK